MSSPSPKHAPQLPKLLQEAIDKFAQDQGLLEYKLFINSGSNKGENFMGTVINVIVEGSGKDDYKRFDLMIKYMAHSKQVMEGWGYNLMCSAEASCYNLVFPQFDKLLERKNLIGEFSSLVKCYKTIAADGMYGLIMENMRPLGYRFFGKNSFDYNHVVLVMKSFGKFHALSFALRDQNPEVFQEIEQALGRPYFSRENITKDFPIKYFPVVLKALSREKDLYERFENYFNKVGERLGWELERESVGRYAVVNHGDTWKNNLLFKYGDTSDPDKPTGLMFVDWQLSRVNSPMVDLSYFFFTCTEKELRDRYYDHFLDVYYESLSSFLKQLGSDPDVLYPRKVFQEHTHTFLGFGLYMGIILSLVMHSEEDEIVNYQTLSPENFQPEEIRAQDVYEKRIRDVVYDCVQWGYL